MYEGRAKDRRIRKTEVALHNALAGLIREKPYDDIVVKEILKRANVGRSTFYTHFSGKDELLLSGIQDMLRAALAAGGGPSSAKPEESLLGFSLPILEHIEQHRRAGEATIGPQGRRAMHDRLRHAVMALIEDDVRAALGRSGRMAGHPSPDLLVEWIASSFVLVLNWWVESDSPLPAREADSLFRRLVGPSLAERFG